MLVLGDHGPAGSKATDLDKVDIAVTDYCQGQLFSTRLLADFTARNHKRVK